VADSARPSGSLLRCVVACAAALPAGCSSRPRCEPAGGVICTIAGTGDNGYGGDGGEALDAVMSLPQDVIAGPGGDLYVLDWNNHRVRAITPDGRMEAIAGSGQVGGDPLDPTGIFDSGLHHPTGMLLDAERNTLVIAGWHQNQVREVDLASGEITVVAGTGDYGYTGDDGPAVDARLELPTAVVRSPDGELVVMDQVNQVIRVIDGGGVIRRLAGLCITERPGGCGVTPLAPCPGSDKLSCDAAVCDYRCAGGYTADGGDAADLRMAQPGDYPGGRMIYDGDGNLLFADPDNHLIRRIAPDGRVDTVAGTAPVDGEPQSGYAGDGGPATAALLDGPVDLARGGDGTLYLSDVYNHCIRAIAADGTIRSVAGTCGERGYAGDGGPATAALLDIPYGIEVIGDALYIADTGNSVIREVGLR